MKCVLTVFTKLQTLFFLSSCREWRKQFFESAVWRHFLCWLTRTLSEIPFWSFFHSEVRDHGSRKYFSSSEPPPWNFSEEFGHWAKVGKMRMWLYVLLEALSKLAHSVKSIPDFAHFHSAYVSHIWRHWTKIEFGFMWLSLTEWVSQPWSGIICLHSQT